MQRGLRGLLIQALKGVLKKLEKDECDVTEQEAMSLLGTFSHEALSKEQACSFLNVSRSTFDNYIKQGKITGRKRRGFKEKVYYKDELINVLQL